MRRCCHVGQEFSLLNNSVAVGGRRDCVSAGTNQPACSGTTGLGRPTETVYTANPD
jgi:hypothetical protein